jgi:hypothetical protein
MQDNYSSDNRARAAVFTIITLNIMAMGRARLSTIIAISY